MWSFLFSHVDFTQFFSSSQDNDRRVVDSNALNLIFSSNCVISKKYIFRVSIPFFSSNCYTAKQHEVSLLLSRRCRRRQKAFEAFFFSQVNCFTFTTSLIQFHEIFQQFRMNSQCLKFLGTTHCCYDGFRKRS